MDKTQRNADQGNTTNASLDTADAVARAAHLWVRSICLNENQRPDECHAMAGGLIAGLCECLAVDARVRELVAYVYMLLDDEGSQALAVSRLMLDDPAPEALRDAWERGRSEATGIVEMLLFHDGKIARYRHDHSLRHSDERAVDRDKSRGGHGTTLDPGKIRKR